MEIINYPIKPEKEKSWHFKSHPYFTKQASNVVATYIEHYSKEGDTVLDPFGGTGVTAIEALRLKRKAVIVDINPLACFIIRQTCQQTNINEFKRAFNELESKVKNQIQAFYQIPNEELAKTEPEHWYPKNIPLPRNADFEFVHELYTPRQLHSYALLFAEIQQIENSAMREMMKYVFSATMTRGNLTFHDSEKILENGEIKKINGGSVSFLTHYRYWKPPKLVETNIWKLFESRFKDIIKGKEKWNDLTQDFDVSANLQVIQGSALSISEYLPENSIDYIYTDPPYGGNIAYLDLSTMWNSWLFPEIYDSHKIDQLKQAEVIEGGDLEKTQDDYSRLFAKSFEEMGKVLKKDGWLSCVFAHKKLEFWNTIVESCEENGMEFKGSTYQPTNNSSMHYKKNPANVLCSQRIANFKKTFNKSVRPQPDDLQKFIFNEIDRAILETHGASIDIIYQRVLDRLLQTKSMSEAKKKGYLALDKFLDDESHFVFEPNTQLYYVKNKTEKHKQLEQAYLAHLDQMRIYLKELFAKHKALTIDQIHKELFEIFSEDKKFPIEKDLPILLSEIAHKSPKTGKWVIKQGEAIAINFENINAPKLVKVQSDGFSHSEIIFRLVKIGEYLGFKSWVGKREQTADNFQGTKFSEISLTVFPIQNVSEQQKAKIQQIDVIWIDKLGFPRYAFEVEESTSIVSGFERFMNLLEVQPDIAKKLYIVCPKSREKKLNDVFKNSTYIGHPIYLENKVGYMFKENLVKFYDEHLDKSFTEQDLKMLYNSVNLN